MKRIILFTIVLTATTIPATARKEAIASRANASINLAAFYSGIPEVQGDYFINRYVGGIVAAGYLNKPLRGFVKVYSYDVLTDAHGAYFKIGIKGRYVKPGKSRHIAPVPWLQVLYIYSMYDEKGYYEYDLGAPPDYHEYKGAANGIAASIGGDFPVWKRLDIKLGFQFALYYDRKDFLGPKFNTFQPGIGAEPGILLLGLNYRFGTIIQQRKEKKAG